MSRSVLYSLYSFRSLAVLIQHIFVDETAPLTQATRQRLNSELSQSEDFSRSPMAAAVLLTPQHALL